jgi:primosomal protein N' (replication factor Y)
MAAHRRRRGAGGSRRAQRAVRARAPAGLLVVDEEHEPAYKQDEAPRYGARDVAVMRGHLEGCAVGSASATPSLESYRHGARRQVPAVKDDPAL